MGMIIDSGTVEKAFGAVQTQKEYSTWSCLLAEYRFFNPGILYWHTGLDRDLVCDFINQFDIPPAFRPSKVAVSRPIYKIDKPVVDLKQGLDTIREDLSKLLYVCPNKSFKQGEPTVWEQLRSFIEGIDFVDIKTGYYACAVEQADMKIFDFQAVMNSKFSDNMYIPVATWGLYTNRDCVFWRTNTHKPGVYSTPVATVFNATEMSKEEAMKFFKEL